MNGLKRGFASIVAVAISTSSSLAGTCDYRPSKLIGGVGTGAIGTTGVGVATAGVAAKAAGFYTLTHAVTGATMLGSTAGGASAAGTVGIMGGTAGLVGSAASVIMAPITIIAGAVIGAGVTAFEGICYFVVERVDDYETILNILDNLSQNADEEYLKLKKVGEGWDVLLVAEEHGGDGKATSWKKYDVKNLYIEEGILKHKDLGLNTVIGKVSMGMPEMKQE